VPPLGSQPGVGAAKQQNSICSQRVRAVGVTAEVADYCYYSRALQCYGVPRLARQVGQRRGKHVKDRDKSLTV
jgi:hypothetical protein